MQLHRNLLKQTQLSAAIKGRFLLTSDSSVRTDSKMICSPSVAITEAKTRIPCKSFSVKALKTNSRMNCYVLSFSSTGSEIFNCESQAPTKFTQNKKYIITMKKQIHTCTCAHATHTHNHQEKSKKEHSSDTDVMFQHPTAHRGHITSITITYFFGIRHQLVVEHGILIHVASNFSSQKSSS